MAKVSIRASEDGWNLLRIVVRLSPFGSSGLAGGIGGRDSGTTEVIGKIF
jgi:hypothetical protein